MSKVKVCIEVDFDIRRLFKKKVISENSKQAQVLQAAMKSYIEGKLELRGTYLVATAQPEQVPLKEPVKAVGRPKMRESDTPKPFTEKALYDHPIPVMIGNPEMLANGVKYINRYVVGKVSYTDDVPREVEDLISTEFVFERKKHDSRMWFAGGKFKEFVGHCVGKFFTLNPTIAQEYLYDYDKFDDNMFDYCTLLEDEYLCYMEGREHDAAK